MNITILQDDEIRNAISQAVQEALTQHLPKMIREINSKPVYTISETCDLLGVTRRHLQHLRDTEQISYIQNGRKILFRADDLEMFFNKHYIKAG